MATAIINAQLTAIENAIRSIPTNGVEEAVASWLEDHPEATTTVQDGSITEEKIESNALVSLKNYVVTPQMYGAKADGNTDDTEAIQVALNAHKKVYFPQGTYKITAPLVISNGHTIEGDSKYSATILAYGCDCIQMTAGDSGERGTIKCIHLRGDYTADTKGIKLAALAPGWLIFDVWIDSFDYGVYGFNVGHVNNIYISQCIITGKLSDRMACHAGVHLANSVNGQINACVIRDTEINAFERGVIIGGTANSVVQCTIQNCDYGIVVDPAIGQGTASVPLNTLGLTINGNYMELIHKNEIYIKSSFATNEVGFNNGIQITNNYFYKPSGFDTAYAVIKLDRGSKPYGDSPNSGKDLGSMFGSMLIGMNQFNISDNAKRYDMKGCLSRDSIIMDGRAGTTVNMYRSGESLGIGAHLAVNGLKYEKVNFHNYGYRISGDATIDSDFATVTLNEHGKFALYISRPNLVYLQISASADEYPVFIASKITCRSAYDGKLYNGQNILDASRVIEDEENFDPFGHGSIQLREPLVNYGYVAFDYQALTDFAWNDYSGYVIYFHARQYSTYVTPQNVKLSFRVGYAM